MSVTPETLNKINSLRQGIEAATGETYPDLTAGVQALKNGYGQGGEAKEEQEKTVDITANGTVEVVPDEGKTLSKVTANVNVASTGEVGKPYIDTSKMTSFYYFCYKSANLDVINEIDTSNGTDFSNMFNSCTRLTTIPQLDTSKGTNFSNMFKDCQMCYSFPKLNTSNGTNFSSMYYACGKLISVPELDTSNGINFSSMFYSCLAMAGVINYNTSKCTNFSTMLRLCKKITAVSLDTSNGTKFSDMFRDCISLETVSITTAKSNFSTSSFDGCTALKNITIGEGWAVNIYLHYSNNLTVESLHGMIENLADLTGQTAKVFQVGATNVAKIDEAHITMLNNKNWNYS